MSVIRDLFTSSINSTMMSINERFTYLQKNVRPVQTSLMTIRTNIAAHQQASAKNMRLAMQMERRLSAMAALRIKKRSIRQRLGAPMTTGMGPGMNMRDRITVPNRGLGRLRAVGRNLVRPRGRSLRRSVSVQPLSGGNMQRSLSMQSLNNDMAVRRRSRSRSRPRSRAPSVGPKEPVPRPRRSRAPSVPRPRRSRAPSVVRQGPRKPNQGFFVPPRFIPPRFRRAEAIDFRNRRARIIGLQRDQRRDMFRRGGRNVYNFPNRGRGGSFRGRGGPGLGRGGLTRTIAPGRKIIPEPVPTKEELDKELEQYMANTKSQLDKDIDTYMKENEDSEMVA